MLFTRECADQIQLAINHLGTLRLTPDELEWLRRENLRLKRQLEEKDMVVELLKKVKEFEGM